MIKKSQIANDMVIQKMQAKDVESVSRLLMQSWIETYVNKDFDITEKWVRQRWEKRLTPGAISERKQELLADQKSIDKESFVVKNKSGKVIGMIGFFRDKNGRQELGAIYVDKSYYGKGVANMLMYKLIELTDPQKDIYLGVVVYNARAKMFYKKWGFKEVAGSESLFDNKLPEIKMIRQGVVK